MKYKKCSWVLFMVFLTVGTMAETVRYNIEGNVRPQNNGKEVMLFQFIGNKVSNVDTCIVDKNKFYFEGQCDTCKYAMISCGNYPDTVLAAKLMLENGVINVRLDKRSVIGGTPLNDIYQDYLAKLYSISDSLKENENRTDLDSIAQTEKEKNLSSILDELKTDLIKNNIKNPLGLCLFKQKLFNFRENDFYEIYHESDSQLKNDKDIIRYIRWMEKDKEKNQKRYQNQAALVGTKYTDLEFLTPTGEKKKLSDYVGKSKYVLLDFWASWCHPCMEEQPLIKEMYTKYKDKGLEIIGISLDDNKTLWKNAINKIQMTWPQLRNSEGDSTTQKAYKFIGIPYTVLIDQQGSILNTNMRGGDLKTTLLRLFPE